MFMSRNRRNVRIGMEEYGHTHNPETWISFE